MDAVKEVITLKDVDHRIKGSVKNHIFHAVMRKYPQSVITDDEFMQLAEESLLESVKDLIREYYSFLGQVDVEVSLEDLKVLYKEFF